jgi:hypothetical protein
MRSFLVPSVPEHGVPTRWLLLIGENPYQLTQAIVNLKPCSADPLSGILNGCGRIKGIWIVLIEMKIRRSVLFSVPYSG